MNPSTVVRRIRVVSEPAPPMATSVLVPKQRGWVGLRGDVLAEMRRWGVVDGPEVMVVGDYRGGFER